MTKKNLQTNLKQAKNIGSAKSGVGHWWHQRLTAVIMIPLFMWLIYFIKFASSMDTNHILLAIKKPWNLSALIMLLIAALYHAMLGMRVIIEDYIHNNAWRISLIVSMQIFTLITIITTIISLFSIKIA